MNRVFLRFVAPVFLSIALAATLVYLVITVIFGEPIRENAEKQAAPQIFLLEQYIDKAPGDEWLQRLNKVREVSQVKFELIPLRTALTQLNESQKAHLMDGSIVIDAPGRAFYRRVDLTGYRYVDSENDVLYAQDLPIDMWQFIRIELLRYILVALVLLVPLAFWSRNHWREVQALAKVTARFGDGDLAARASTPIASSVYPLSLQINEMAERIAKLLTSQRQLLHAVSHELRTPIARLEFALEILQDTSHDAKVHHKIDAMRGDLFELNALVSELLNLAKMEQQHDLRCDRFVAEEFAMACIQSLPPMREELQLGTIIEPASLVISGDQRLLARAAQNLLKNAMKYASKSIHFEVRASKEGFQIIVEDDGLGIPESERNNVFEAFYRLDRSRDRNSGGFGLGLAIVRQIVEMHNGKVEVGNAKLGGARFCMCLPHANIVNNPSD
ncbi:ATP-binding protein [Undibacterium cyanobacteriorum]|uniref:histidine kinase n=1 Tax=Undibacterium cyanobacteriorum TaxID=3073561 RepID=A0ABY9RK61_9BURK|nr:ATP-binding protein [Undibacterium sp. 20NA77.5]WMW81621.1 ATP-binding protein [Undibacterium sp. 20NA77.5]